MTSARRLLTVVALLTLAACSTGPDAAYVPSVTPYVAPNPTPTAASTDAYTAQRIACHDRKSSGDIIVRESGPDIDDNALALGGGYFWEDDAKACVTTVQLTLDTAPAENCEEIARAKDNPGYDVDRRPPAPLKRIIARSDAC